MVKKKQVKKCKTICTNCEHIRLYGEPKDEYGNLSQLDSPECFKYSKVEMNCVDGSTTRTFAKCCDKNKNGCCPKFKLNRADYDKKKLITMLGTYKRNYHPMDFACGNDVIGEIINELIRLLDGNESALIEIMGEEDEDGMYSPYDYHVVATKELYDRTKRVIRNNRKHEI